MAVDYKELKKGGFMRQRQKDHFSMRLKSVGGTSPRPSSAPCRKSQSSTARATCT